MTAAVEVQTLTPGRYQVDETILTVTTAARDGDLLIWRGTPGKLRGPRRVHRGTLVGRDVRDRILDPAAAQLLADPAAARARYAQATGRCSRCGRTLTDSTSRAAGIGPECIRRAVS